MAKDDMIPASPKLLLCEGPLGSQPANSIIHAFAAAK